MALGQHKVSIKRKSGGTGYRRSSDRWIDPKDDLQMRQALMELLPKGENPANYKVAAYKGTSLVREISG